MNEDSELDWLKKAAGINDKLGNPTHNIPVDRSVMLREKNIKPGSKEYIDMMFPLNPNSFPTGFRGRKKTG